MRFTDVAILLVLLCIIGLQMIQIGQIGRIETRIAGIEVQHGP